uniref:YSIRK-type signal peptide-containing protein n=1 Tax=Gemella cuniculi TaxID=150240 RepID=UPI00054FA434
MQNKLRNLNNEKRTKWSIRRLSGVGVASVIVASSLVGTAAEVKANDAKVNKIAEMKEAKETIKTQSIDDINKKLEMTMTGKTSKKSDMMSENVKTEKKEADKVMEAKPQSKDKSSKKDMNHKNNENGVTKVE